MVLPELGNFSGVTDIWAYSAQATSQSIQQNSRFTTGEDDIENLMKKLLGSREASQTGVAVVEGETNELSVQLNTLSVSEPEKHAKMRDLPRNKDEGDVGDDCDDSDDVGYVPGTP